VGTIQRLAQSSIDQLKNSFDVLMNRLLKELGEASPTVQMLCCEKALGSLLLLQVQTAKDLGKVYVLASRYSPGVSRTDGRNYMLFAQAVSVRLLGDRHPSTKNIKRLLNGLSPRLSSEFIYDETVVDRWLSEIARE